MEYGGLDEPVKIETDARPPQLKQPRPAIIFEVLVRLGV